MSLSTRPCALGPVALLAAFVMCSATAQEPKALFLPQLGVSFAPRSDAGPRWRVDSQTSGQASYDLIQEPPGGGRLRFMINRAQAGATCDKLIDLVAKGDPARRVSRAQFLPLAGWYPEAALGQAGMYTACADSPRGPVIATIIESTGAPADAVRIRGVLEPVAAAVNESGVASAAGSAGGSGNAQGPRSVVVNVNRDRLRFEIPARAWTWEARPTELGRDQGAVLAGTGSESRKLQITIRAVPSANSGGSCMELVAKFGPSYRDFAWGRLGFNEYFVKRNEQDVTLCTSKTYGLDPVFPQRTYYLVSVVGDLNDTETRTEAFRILELVSRTSIAVVR